MLDKISVGIFKNRLCSWMIICYPYIVKISPDSTFCTVKNDTLLFYIVGNTV